MNNYKVEILPKAREDLRRALNYLIYVKLSPKAADSVLKDFEETIEKLSYLADSYQMLESDILRKRSLKRVNFSRHKYFLLYKIENDKVFITNIFHAREDFENKL